jgi:hypothetical protein
MGKCNAGKLSYSTEGSSGVRHSCSMGMETHLFHCCVCGETWPDNEERSHRATRTDRLPTMAELRTARGHS